MITPLKHHPTPLPRDKPGDYASIKRTQYAYGQHSLGQARRVFWNSEREPVPGYGQHLKPDHFTHRFSNSVILSTSWHVESFNLSREFTQQNRLIYLICHLPLWRFRDVLFNISIWMVVSGRQQFYHCF